MRNRPECPYLNTRMRSSSGLNVFSPGSPARSAERHLRYQPPLFGQTPAFAYLVVDQWVVMLQRRAEPSVFEHRPYRQLVHGRGLFGPDGEVAGVTRKFLLQVADDVRIFEEEHRAVPPRTRSIFSSVRANASSGTIARSVRFTIFHNSSWCSCSSSTARVDCELKADGTCLIAKRTISSICASSTGDSGASA